MDAREFTQDSASEIVTMSAAPATRPATFFSLPQELRDLIYSYLFKAVYTQLRVDMFWRNLQDGCPEDAEAETSKRLGILQASKRLCEEGSSILYGNNHFRFHTRPDRFAPAILTWRTADLLQDIEINLYPYEALAGTRMLQFFGSPRIPRKSCLIRFKSSDMSLTRSKMIEALRQLTGFKIVTFQVDVPVQHHLRLLKIIKTNMIGSLGPCTYLCGNGIGLLVFNPQDRQIGIPSIARAAKLRLAREEASSRILEARMSGRTAIETLSSSVESMFWYKNISLGSPFGRQRLSLARR